MHPFTQRLQKMKKEGIEPTIVFMLSKVSEEEAFAKEIELISKYGRKDLGKGTLLNLTDGGNTPGAWNKGKKMSEEAKANQKKALEACGLTSWNQGKKHSEETKQTIREKNLGKKLSPETIAKREATKIARGTKSGGRQAGYKVAEETKEKIRAKRKEQIYSKEAKKKMSESARNRKQNGLGCPRVSCFFCRKECGINILQRNHKGCING